MIKLLKRCAKWLWVELPDCKLFRFVCLVACAALGFAFWCSTLSDNCNLFETFEDDWLAPITAIKAESHAARFAHPFALSLFVLLALWYFRTRDTLRRIAGADAQLQQNNFAIGINNLMQDDPMTIGVGVTMLLQVSEKTDSFDNLIRDAFISRLRKNPKMPNLVDHVDSSDDTPHEKQKKVELTIPPKLTYAQYILQWLIVKQEHYAKKPNLRGMRCDYQEFKVSGLDLVKILPTPSETESPVSKHHELRVSAGLHWVVSFMLADCETLNFDGTDLEIYLTEGAINITIDGKPFQSSRDTLKPDED